MDRRQTDIAKKELCATVLTPIGGHSRLTLVFAPSLLRHKYLTGYIFELSQLTARVTCQNSNVRLPSSRWIARLATSPEPEQVAKFARSGAGHLKQNWDIRNARRPCISWSCPFDSCRRPWRISDTRLSEVAPKKTFISPADSTRRRMAFSETRNSCFRRRATSGHLSSGPSLRRRTYLYADGNSQRSLKRPSGGFE